MTLTPKTIQIFLPGGDPVLPCGKKRFVFPSNAGPEQDIPPHA